MQSVAVTLFGVYKQQICTDNLNTNFIMELRKPQLSMNFIAAVLHAVAAIYYISTRVLDINFNCS